MNSGSERREGCDDEKEDTEGVTLSSRKVPMDKKKKKIDIRPFSSDSKFRRKIPNKSDQALKARPYSECLLAV